MVKERQCNCRITDKNIDEIAYIDTYWDGSFSNYVHNSIKRDIKQIDSNKNRKQLDLFKDLGIYIVLIALGSIFFLFGIQTTNLVSMAVYYVIGLFLVVMGITGGMVIALQSTRQHNTRRK